MPYQRRTIGASCAYFRDGLIWTIGPARRREADVAKKTTSSRDGRTRQSKSSAKQPRPSAKRDLVRGPQASSYAKRTAKGRFKEMDGVGRSQKADKPRKAKRAVQSGYGDQGDQKPPRLRAAKAYAALGLAKGLRAAARTMSLARGQVRKS